MSKEKKCKSYKLCDHDECYPKTFEDIEKHLVGRCDCEDCKKEERPETDEPQWKADLAKKYIGTDYDLIGAVLIYENILQNFITKLLDKQEEPLQPIHCSDNPYVSEKMKYIIRAEERKRIKKIIDDANKMLRDPADCVRYNSAYNQALVDVIKKIR